MLRCDAFSPQVELKKAVPKEESRPVNYSTNQKTKKVFLGGLAPETTKEDIKESLYTVVSESEVEDVQIMTEKITEKPRGFGFAIFSTCEVADLVCSKKYFKIRVFLINAHHKAPMC